MDYRRNKAGCFDLRAIFCEVGGTPVVLLGHHGGSRQASRSFQMHSEWPEAIVVYMQGLPTPGQWTDPDGKKPGWQSLA